MRYRKRLVEAKVLNLFGQFPAVIVTGARQSGKSTLIGHMFGGSMRQVVFDPVVDVGNARRDPEMFLSLNPPPIVLDEIQYAPEILPIVKRLIDSRPGDPGLFVITGSQHMGVMKGASESLAGRAAVVELPPMSRREIEEETGAASPIVDLLSAPSRPPLELTRTLAAAPVGSLSRIFRGGYPRTMDMDEAGASAWFDGYLRTYVERDVRALGNVEDLQAFTRFTRMCAQLTSGEVNRSHVGREIGMDPKTAGRWLSVLESSFQWLEIPPWTGNAVKRLSGRHKGHFTDTGFAAFLASISSPEALASHPLSGSLFETYVTCEIRKVLQVLPVPPSMYHWRTHGGAEVDLILEKDGFFWPIEVKLASRPSARDVRGLDAFEETYPRLRVPARVVVSGGAEAYMLDQRTIVMPAWLI